MKIQGRVKEAALVGFDPATREYEVVVPASVTGLGLGALLSADAPEGSAVTAQTRYILNGYDLEQPTPISPSESVIVSCNNCLPSGEEGVVSVNIFFTISTNIFSPIAPPLFRRPRQRGCAASG